MRESNDDKLPNDFSALKALKAEKDVPEISGTVEGIIYRNDDNGYCVFDISTDANELVTVKGIVPTIGEGDLITVYGKWTHDAKYGRQFSAEQYKIDVPSDSASALRYLSSRAIKGIGPKLAKKIIEKFGDQTFDIIENHPDWLAEIKGISKSKANEISEDFKSKVGIRNAMMFFGDYFGASLIVKIYKHFGGNAVDIAKANPYALCEEIDGIGFEKADNLAKRIGFPEGSHERLKSGIIYVLRHNTIQNGHTCLPREKLVMATAKALEANEKNVDSAISELISEKRLCINIFSDTQYVFDKYTYDCEKYVASKLLQIDRMSIPVDVTDVNAFLDREENESGIKYAGLQRQAISDSLLYGVLILTGGPGTGKTTVVKALLHIFESMGYKVALCAPTGRAAKRLSESTGKDAKTVHRLLEMSYSGDDTSDDARHSEFMRNENNLLDENVIIVDEASMVDIYLMSSLLKAIKPGAKMIIIGDVDQLPSVGAGDVLRDLIESDRFSVVRLNQVFRQAMQSAIVTNAHEINSGRMPDLGIKDNDFFFLPRNTDKDIAMTIADLCKNRLPKAYGSNIINDIQVISPSRRGEGGTDHLNMLLQSVLNPSSKFKREYIHKDVTFREGDKVMQIKNNYDLEWRRPDDSVGQGIFNGDIGEIRSINRSDSSMNILFEDREVVYDFSLLDELSPAYAITVHKSQGSEYPVVIIPLYNAPPMLMTRNLFYTAVTRAERMVILVGRREIAEKMIENNRQSLRYTGLAKRLFMPEK